MKEIRWHGRGGHGGFTAARLLGMAASVYGNYYAQAFPSFGPERRGAPVLGFTRVDNKPIHDHSKVYTCDYVVVLDESLLETIDVKEGLKKGGTLLINSILSPDKFKDSEDYNVHTIDATSLALEVLGVPVTNTAMLGALVAVADFVSLEAVLQAIERSMPKELQEKNKKVVKMAYEKLREGKIHA
ncbi:MAG: pyruvate ferredoxin oxidoreductase [Peptococcaceae bacterium]|uniref:Pyruvate ferredoxin oxidoreductase n=1 Tax=Thermanaerosceptrum fracticalcis TaxID=1712410 RepID=A0A7G6E372_THEFR|nr:2-oxoacid:acceptor oxidoreductase family protein [Thermanaerosceptrum fracticalcis]MBZ4655114.1 pyruvate ferredoxin oxidoreductase [Peptococcaceae bacterium]QNB46526.1 pyruvate ferredoxin oxidoreductase [Thermanaerosceptrum fracticalcis]